MMHYYFIGGAASLITCFRTFHFTNIASTLRPTTGNEAGNPAEISHFNDINALM